MTDFVKRVVQKVAKLTPEQIGQFVENVADENALLDAVLESISTGILVCSGDWMLLKANKSAERFLSIQEQHNSPVWEHVTDVDIADFLRKNYDRQKNIVSEEFTVELFGGSARIVTVSIMPLVQKKRVAGNIIKIDDITEKRNQETLLRRMENLASLTNLAASVAHEIKNPLGSISIHIQLIQKAIAKARTEKKLPEKKYAEEYLEVINQEIERLNQIIVDFLFAVRPIRAHLQPCNFNQLIKNMAQFFEPELEKQSVLLTLNLAENIPSLMLDEKLCKQMIINLVQNSLAAMPNGGKLNFETQLKNEKCVFKIADTGIGMDEETKSRIFEPYFSTKSNGTGLGLTMVYKIIKEHSGDVGVQSFPHDGTEFTIILPVPQKEKHLLEHIAKTSNV